MGNKLLLSVRAVKLVLQYLYGGVGQKPAVVGQPGQEVQEKVELCNWRQNPLYHHSHLILLQLVTFFKYPGVDSNTTL